MTFPSECLQRLISIFQAGFPVHQRYEAVQCLASLLMYIVSRIAEHGHQPLFGSNGTEQFLTDEECEQCRELALAAGVPITYSGLFTDWLIRMLLPGLIDRVFDSETVKKSIDEVMEKLTTWLEKQLESK